jgi:hypothetical protein
MSGAHCAGNPRFALREKKPDDCSSGFCHVLFDSANMLLKKSKAA